MNYLHIILSLIHNEPVGTAAFLVALISLIYQWRLLKQTALVIADLEADANADLDAAITAAQATDTPHHDPV